MGLRVERNQRIEVEVGGVMRDETSDAIGF